MKRDGRVSRAAFWRCWVLVGYYSGLRFGDLHRLEWSDISTDGVLSVVQNKTGDLTSCQLPADALAALSAIHSDQRRHVFADLLNRQHTQQGFRKIVRAAGLQGSPKWLRRSGASFVEALLKGGARDFLGHRSGIQLAHAHYVDPTVAQRLKPTPPRIEGPGKREAS